MKEIHVLRHVNRNLMAELELLEHKLEIVIEALEYCAGGDILGLASQGCVYAKAKDALEKIKEME